MATEFHLAAFPEEGDPYIKSCETLQGLANALKALPEGTQGFCFHGERINITCGPWRYLVLGDQTVPAFDPPRPGKIDKSASLGKKDPEDPTSATYSEAIKSLPKPPEEAGEEDLPKNA